MKNEFMDFNVKFGLEKVWKWKFWILGGSIVSGLVAFLYSSMLAPEFMSTSAFIPPGISSIYSLNYNAGLGYKGFEAGEEEDVDRVVDYLTSIQVTDSIAKRFDLYNHYGIKVGALNWEKNFYNAYRGKNKVTFSTHSTVYIECYDTDPKIASGIANMYLELAEGFMESLSNRKTGLKATEEALDRLNKERTMVLDTLKYYRDKHKVFHFDNMEHEITGLLASQLRNDPVFAQQYDRVLSLELQLNFIEERHGELKREYESRNLCIQQYPSLIKVTQMGKPSTFKARPKRSLYLVLGALSAMVFGSFVAVVFDRSRASLPI